MAEVGRRRKRGQPLTVDHILAGADRADLVVRAGEIARAGTSPMLLVWYDGDEVLWRNAGMDNGATVFACEVVKLASLGVIGSGDADD